MWERSRNDNHNRSVFSYITEIHMTGDYFKINYFCVHHLKRGDEMNYKIHMQENREVIWDEDPPFPKNIMIEHTNACNHSCFFCGNKHQKGHITKVDREIVLSIIEQTASCNSAMTSNSF